MVLIAFPKVAVFVKALEEVAKIHPFVAVAVGAFTECGVVTRDEASGKR